MFTKEERKAVHEAFWMRFKKHIKKVEKQQFINSNHRKINWINYPTGVKEIYIRLDINQKQAKFSIDFQSKDPEILNLIWEQMQELKVVFENEMGTTGTWDEHATNKANQAIKSIYWTLPNVSIYNPKDEAEIFIFFQSKLFNFHKFYDEFNEVFFGLLH